MWMARFAYVSTPAFKILIMIAAAVFGYFEQLLQVGDPAKITEVIAFLNSFNDYLPAAGFEIAMVEMFMESAMELLEKMHEALQRQELDGTILLDTMTNEEESNTIVFYFKVRKFLDVAMFPLTNRTRLLSSSDLYRSLQALSCN